MKSNIKDIIITVLCGFFLISIYTIYKNDIKKHDDEVIKVAKEVKNKLDSFNLHIIIKDNEIIKGKQIIYSEEIKQILQSLKRIEEKLKVKE